ncbi:peptidase dimerization domain-containing protein [Streptomyces sp. NPDC057002]|uniref:peptidase dimerization domain-containing protein n=1 Tax=Streptomyces sp. NPDC057002 TaxID=3345992 RepID=UPI00364038F8
MAAHSGLAPYKGASAVHALAELVTRVAGLGSRERGTAVNVGLISGGTGRNVIAGRAAAASTYESPTPPKRPGSTPRWTVPSSTVWERWATAPTPGTNTSCWTTSRRAPRCWWEWPWREP